MWQTICMMSMIIVTTGAVKITPNQSHLLVAEGEPLSINCTAPPGSELEWTRNDSSLPSGVKIRQWTENGDNVSILSARAASLEISGMYRCKDKNNSEEGSIQVTVISVEGALFEYQKGNMLTCNVETGKQGIENVTYKWFKNGTNVEDLPKPKGEKFKLHDNGTLELLPITTTREDAGMYTCELTVTMGAQVNVFKVNVSVPYYAEPKVEHVEKKKDPLEGEKLNISCRVLGYPTPAISWHKDSEEIKPDKNESRYKFSPEGNVPNGQLTIDSVVLGDAGNYMCTASAQHPSFSNGSIVFNSSKDIDVRVKDKLAALWPFLGIVAEVVIVCTIIFIYEKKRNKNAAAEEDINQDRATPERRTEGVRHRGNTNNPRA